MSYLAVPLVDQLTDKTADGRPPEDAAYTCVEASTVAVQQYLTGTRLLTDQLKDMAYGEGWVGKGTAEDALIGIMAAHGVHITRFNGTQAQLWAKAQEEAAAGRPVIISTPSLWDSQPTRLPYTPVTPNFSTHAQVFCGVSGGVGRLMNPWHGVYMDRPVSWFEPRLCWGCIYLTSKESSMTVPAGWTDDGTTLTAPNGIPVVHGFRAYLLALPWDAEDWPLAAEASVASVEVGNPAIGAGSRQDFRKGSLGYTTARGVYPIWVGQDLLAYRGIVADLQAQLAKAQAAVGHPDPIKDAVFAAVQQFKAALGEL